MGEWILIISVSVMVSMPNGFINRETISIETRRPFKSADACERVGKANKFLIFFEQQNKAQTRNADIRSAEFFHKCESGESL